MSHTTFSGPDELTTGLDELEASAQDALRGRVWGFRLAAQSDGLVLLGRSRSFYGKQIAQHFVMARTNLRICANRIVVE